MLGPSGSPRGPVQAAGGSPRQLLRGALLLANGAFGLWEVDVARNELRLVGAGFRAVGQGWCLCWLMWLGLKVMWRLCILAHAVPDMPDSVSNFWACAQRVQSWLKVELQSRWLQAASLRMCT